MAGRAKFILIALISLFGIDLHAQGIPYQLNPPAPNARVQFCSVPDGGYPCPTLTTVYSDSAATQVINQPISTGSSGNLSVYFAAGTSSVTVQFLGQGYGPQNRFVVALGGGSGGAAIAGNANSIYASPACPNPSNGNCFFVNDNLQYVTDATWSNNATPVLVTISGSDPPFKSTDSGKACEGTVGGGATVPLGTFTFLTATTGNCSGTSIGAATGNGVFKWWTDDTALLNAAYAAVLALPHCGALVLPTGDMGFNGPLFTASTPAACITSLNGDGNGVNIQGSGEHATFLVPSNNATASAAGCFVGLNTSSGQIFENLQIFGAGFTGANTANKTGLCLGGTSIGRQIAVTQWGNGASGFQSISFTGQEDSCLQCFADTVGGPAFVNQIQVQFFEFFSSQGLSLAAGASLFDYGGVYTNLNSTAVPNQIGGIYNGSSASFTSTDANPSNGLSIANAAAVFDCSNCSVTDSTNAGSQGIAWAAGGTVILRGNSSISGGATAGAIYNVGVPTAKLYLEDTNTLFSPVTFPNWTGTVSGAPVHTGSCTGTITSSATIGLYGLGNSSTTTCTSTTTNQGFVLTQVGKTGVLSYMSCTAGTAETGGTSDVVTLLDNNVATAITANFATGGAATAIDNTHSVAETLGHVYSIRIVSGTTATLANVTCSVLAL